ncbi:MAG: right-handed parallel beta-helix repeat-containing protein, partial [Planctomycetes bacterium]|nr:right-handed parallel beta-helix repeat-containing protein [Planctomycetota bacterium]
MKAALTLLVLAACGGSARDAAAPPPPVLPAGARTVAPGELVAAVAAAVPGDVLRLLPGDHLGPVLIDKAITLCGPRDAVLRAKEGSTLRVRADGARLQGFTVLGSGQRFDLMDGGVHLQGRDLVLEDVLVRDALFGILVEKCTRATVRGCTVLGTGLPAMGLRGDAIRLWETNDSLVERNVVRDARDLVVWYSSRNRLLGNRVSGSRYGTHFMYSHDNVVEDSEYVDDEVGVFVMYSRGIGMRRNLLARAGGAAGIGIGLKEAGDVTVEDNWLLANTTGVYIDA